MVNSLFSELIIFILPRLRTKTVTSTIRKTLKRQYNKITVNAILTSITTGNAVFQSTIFIEAFQKLATNIELNEIPAKNDGREIALTFEYRRLLYRRCTRKKCIV